METDRYCNVCNDLASYFCRMCSTHYCAAHLCLHLSVAWESNSWTKRNEREIEDERNIRNERTTSSETYGNESRCEIQEEVRDVLSSNAKSVATYSQAQLQAQLQFYMSQARRIRAELERRAVSLESPEERTQRQNLYLRKNDVPKHPTTKRNKKSTIHATELLLDRLRNGSLNLEYIIAQINALAKKS